MNCMMLHYLFVASDCLWNLRSNEWRHSFAFISPDPKIQDFAKDTKQPFRQFLSLFGVRKDLYRLGLVLFNL